MNEAIAELCRHEEHARDVTTMLLSERQRKRSAIPKHAEVVGATVCVVLMLKGLDPDDFEAEVAAGTEGTPIKGG